ncbi:MAG: hypothetical protein HWE26_21450 [Alteromonadaceae bacterium]|nr:hypothetical protein [Alteromonadaceae bacterium]
MNTTTATSLNYARSLTRVGLTTLILLSIPMLGNQLSSDVHWTLLDFAVMGSLLFVFGSVVTVAINLTPARLRLPFATAVTFAFVYLWAELAVGLFFNIGS